MSSISGKQFAKLLERDGWILLRIRGSHYIYGKPGITVRISVPIHGNKPLKIGLLNYLLKIAGFSLDASNKSSTTKELTDEDSTDESE